MDRQQVEQALETIIRDCLNTESTKTSTKTENEQPLDLSVRKQSDNGKKEAPFFVRQFYEELKQMTAKSGGGGGGYIHPRQSSFPVHHQQQQQQQQLFNIGQLPFSANTTAQQFHQLLIAGEGGSGSVSMPKNTVRGKQQKQERQVLLPRVRCESCKKEYKRPGSMRRHQCTRTNGGRLFQCEKCLKTFSLPSALEEHRRTYAGGGEPWPFRCAACPETFARRAALEAHRRPYAAADGTPYRCPRCPNVHFELQCLLRQHQLSVHSHQLGGNNTTVATTTANNSNNNN